MNRHLLAAVIVCTTAAGTFAQGGDECAIATVIAGQGTFSYDTTTSTTSPTPPTCGAVNNDVWFTWTADVTGSATVATCVNTSGDTKIAAYAFDACALATQLGCNDDSCGLRSSMSFPVTAGGVYSLRMGMFSTTGRGVFSFTIGIAPPPVGESCPEAIAIAGDGAFPYSNVGYTASGVAMPCAPANADIWFAWTPDKTGTATIDTCGSVGDTTLTVWDASGGCPPTIALACNDDACSLQSRVSVPVTCETTYLIQLGSFTAAGNPGTLNIATAGVGSDNDSCLTAELIAGQGSFPFSTICATDSNPPGACTAMSNDVWFDWTADADGTATVDTCDGSVSFDSKLAAWTGGSCPTTCITSNDDSCGLQSEISFAVTNGTSYKIQVGGFSSSQEGTGNLEIAIASPPDNDDCVDAEEISGLGTFPWDNSLATTDDPGSACGTINRDVWFLWTAPSDGTYTADTCGTSFDTILAVWEGSACPPTSEVGCNDDSCGLQSSVGFDAVGGSQYLIEVGAFSTGPAAGQGPGVLNIDVDPCSTVADDGFEENDDCASAASVGEGSFADLFVWKLDEDWYSITVLDGETLTVDTLFTHDDGDIDIFLFDACAGTLLDFSTSIDDDEQVMWTNTTGGAVDAKLQVLVWSGSASDCNDYDLGVDIEGGGIGTKYCSANSNSTGSPADISASGSNSSVAGNLTLEASPVPNETGIFFHGDSQVQIPFGNGFRCVAGAIARGLVVSAAGNLASYTYDNTHPKRDLSAYIGTNRNFQFWHRDPMGGGSMFNTSNAISIDIEP